MLTRDEANNVVLMAADEMLACHDMLTAEGVPDEVDGERLSLSQRLRLFLSSLHAATSAIQAAVKAAGVKR